MTALIFRNLSWFQKNCDQRNHQGPGRPQRRDIDGPGHGQSQTRFMDKSFVEMTHEIERRHCGFCVPDSVHERL